MKVYVVIIIIIIITTSIPLVPFPSKSPSLISLVVSVDVKHHVDLLTYTSIPPSPPPSLISLVVSVDVKYRVDLLTTPYPPPHPTNPDPNKPCGFCGR